MTEKFTASNGVEVERRPDGSLEMYGYLRGYLLDEHETALREFFLHEAGIWRDPETGALVIPDHQERGDQYLSIFIDGTMHGGHKSDLERPATVPKYEIAARYFAAHPEVKPWHDAKPGEVWVVRVIDDDMVMTVHESEYGGRRFRRNDSYGTIYALDTPSIREARRIWPEVSDG